MIDNWLKKEAPEIASKLNALNHKALGSEVISGFGMKSRVDKFIDLVRTAMFPSVFHEGVDNPEFLDVVVCDKLQQAAILLLDMVSEVLVNRCTKDVKDSKECDGCKETAKSITSEFMNSLPSISEILYTDIQAAYEGDPAAMSKEEILLSYPAFDAISIFRLAHKLFELKVPLIPRIMTEYAYSRTGIDIHPGATIGDYFFIDHGTGIVIGETCVIGKHVKIYQGVTLGARSFELDENGNPVKGIKRHPNIGDNVIIYSGATILGGDTNIGEGSVIGGNVWLMESVEPHSTVYNSTPDPKIK